MDGATVDKFAQVFPLFFYGDTEALKWEKKEESKYYATFKSLSSPFRMFFMLLLYHFVIATCSSDWSVCTTVLWCFCCYAEAWMAFVRTWYEVQNWEKINIQIHSSWLSFGEARRRQQGHMPGVTPEGRALKCHLKKWCKEKRNVTAVVAYFNRELNWTFYAYQIQDFILRQRGPASCIPMPHQNCWTQSLESCDQYDIMHLLVNTKSAWNGRN